MKESLTIIEELKSNTELLIKTLNGLKFSNNELSNELSNVKKIFYNSSAFIWPRIDVYWSGVLHLYSSFGPVCAALIRSLKKRKKVGKERKEKSPPVKRNLIKNLSGPIA